MSEWGRKEYSKAWPSRTPVWTWTATLLSLAFFVGMLSLQYKGSWTAAERLYLTDYLKSGARGKVSATAASKYTLLEAVVGKGQRLVMGDEIEQVPSLDGRPGYRLTDEGVKNGIARLVWVRGTFNDRGLHRIMNETVYDNVGSWEFYRLPVSLAVAFFVLALFLAVPKDRGATDDLAAWPEATRAGVGDDGGVQREVGQVEAVDYSTAGWHCAHQ